MKSGIFGAALLVCLALPTSAWCARPEVFVLPYAGAITAVSAEYITRGIGEAEARNAAAFVLELDTPGGLDSSMRQIIQREMNARIPVIVFVAPRGARAASAGCLIVLGAEVAAMAPGTNIGAAHPVYALGGTVSEKVLNDAASYARSLAAAHKRNVEWSERAVRESVSATAQEALSLGVIDLMAGDVAELLSELNGRALHRASGDVTLTVAGAHVTTAEMDVREKLLAVLTNPTVAYLLLLLGTLAIVIELFAPHGFVTGTVGAVAVLLALVGLANLPVQIPGVAVLVFGILLLGLELKITSHGLLTFVGIFAIVVGSLLLLPRIPEYRISPWAIGTVTLVWVLVLATVVRLVLLARRQPILTGIERVTGREGVAKTDIDPRGVVLVNGEDWDALADAPPITRGDRVTVVSVEGLTLHVRKISQREESNEY